MSSPVQGMFNLFTNYIFNLNSIVYFDYLEFMYCFFYISINFEDPFMEKIVDIYTQTNQSYQAI